jgi:hypothetical protein
MNAAVPFRSLQKGGADPVYDWSAVLGTKGRRRHFGSRGEQQSQYSRHFHFQNQVRR